MGNQSLRVKMDVKVVACRQRILLYSIQQFRCLVRSGPGFGSTSNKQKNEYKNRTTTQQSYAFKKFNNKNKKEINIINTNVHKIGKKT